LAKKSEQNILQAIKFVKAGDNKFLLGKAIPIVKEIINNLKKLPEVSNISSAGSVRRMKEVIGDVDI